MSAVSGGADDTSSVAVRRNGPGEFTFAALAVAGIVVLAFGNGLAVGEPTLALLAGFGLALLVLGTTGAAWALRGVGVRIAAPADATAGNVVELDVAVSRRRAGMGRPACEVRVLDPPSPWHSATIGDHGSLRWRAPRRGVFHTLRVEIRSSWPFGMFQRRRVFEVTLADPLHVAPRPIVAGSTRLAATDDGARPRADPTRSADVVRSVRPYSPGDPQRLVHWRSTARTGELMVREFDPTAAPAVIVRLTLVGDPMVSEPAASRALGIGHDVLRRGQRLVLLTRERSGEQAGSVATERELGRRLARAVPGEPPSVAAGQAAVELP